MAFTVKEIVLALSKDDSPKSGWMLRDGQVVEPRAELFVWTGDFCFWLGASGKYVSGWNNEGNHGGRWFNAFDAWRIRRAVRAWSRRRGFDQ